MTTPDPAATEEPAVTPESEADATVAPDEPAEESTPNQEAAKWRTKFREAEAERDTLTERLIGYQRRECEHAVADLLDEPTDLWDIGQADYAQFYNENGELDEAELRAAAGALIETRPKLAKPPGPRHHDFGQYRLPPPPPSGGWSDLIKG